MQYVSACIVFVLLMITCPLYLSRFHFPPPWVDILVFPSLVFIRSLAFRIIPFFPCDALVTLIGSDYPSTMKMRSQDFSSLCMSFFFCLKLHPNLVVDLSELLKKRHIFLSHPFLHLLVMYFLLLPTQLNNINYSLATSYRLFCSIALPQLLAILLPCINCA